jgi:hypothetical protein
VPITTSIVSSNPTQPQHYVIKFVSDLRQVGGFFRVLRFSSTNKTDPHGISEILLKVALHTLSFFIPSDSGSLFGIKDTSK